MFVVIFFEGVMDFYSFLRNFAKRKNELNIMAKKSSGGIGTINYRDIVNNIRAGQYAPIYLLMGEESYYIDRIAEYIAANILTEEERDFNLTTLYCTRETNVADVINSARRYPMMSKYQILIVKEAQNLQKFDELQHYVENPLESTILVICYKNGTVDSRKKIVKMIDQVGIVFESKRLKEGMLPTFIDDYLRRKQVTIEGSAKMMLVESIGSDLNRLASELDKLCIILPADHKNITPDLIEKNIGISKEFNLWEFRTAVVERNILKANQILDFFNQNLKENPAVMTVSMLFNFFSGVMQAWYAPQKTEQGLMQQLELKNSWQLRDYQTAMRNYNAMKTMLIIGKLRETDAKLKGIGKGNSTDADIMRELLYFILH